MRGLSAGTDVWLRHPELGRLPARVERVEEDRVTLALFVRPDTPVQWVESVEAELETTAEERGVVRARGAVSAEGPGLDALVTVELAESEVVQRRDFVRVDASVPVTVWPGGGPAVETFATNVSGAGFALAGPSGLAVGTRFRFRLRLPDEPALEGAARVVREGERGERGCAFESIDERERELIVRFTFDRQRADLKRGTTR